VYLYKCSNRKLAVKLYLIIAVQLFDLFCSLTHQRFQFTHTALKQLLRLHVFLPQLDEVLSIMQTTVQKCTLRPLTLPWVFGGAAVRNSIQYDTKKSLTWTQKLSDQLNLAHVARKNMRKKKLKQTHASV